MGEDFFSMDNILTGDEAAALFAEEPDIKDNEKSPENKEDKEKDKDKLTEENNITEIHSSEELFGSESESVGDEEKKGGEDPSSTQGSDSPDKPNFYSSITDALVDDGVFPDLDEERVKKVQTPEDFRELIEERIKAEFDERQKRIDEALNAGVDTGIIKQYENTLDFLSKITPEIISEEGDRGDDIRRRILFQDFMNKKFTPENANKMIKMLMDSGEDIDQAKAALEENKKFFGEKYKELLDNAKAEEEEEKQRLVKQNAQLKNDILTSDKIFGEVEIDKATRQKVYDNISKPVYKDAETGEYYTALQKYKKDNENDFIKNVGILFTLTDGFKDLSKLINPSAKKEVKRKMKELEHTLSNTTRDKGGSYQYVGTPQESNVGKSFFDRGYTIDI